MFLYIHIHLKYHLIGWQYSHVYHSRIVVNVLHIFLLFTLNYCIKLISILHKWYSIKFIAVWLLSAFFMLNVFERNQKLRSDPRLLILLNTLIWPPSSKIYFEHVSSSIWWQGKSSQSQQSCCNLFHLEILCILKNRCFFLTDMFEIQTCTTLNCLEYTIKSSTFAGYA